ncbi:MAG: hypothetical protein H0U59_05235 [Gemmatimonadaceae bacterium]|nr:hypothetical protein [Gemmatimonadaceae bacterium]
MSGWSPESRKLTFGAVQLIRKQYNYGQERFKWDRTANPFSGPSLARAFGVSPATIFRIVRGLAYGDVP